MSIFDDLLSDPVALNRYGTTLDVGSKLYGALSHVQFGRQAQAAADFQAAQLRQNAGQANASSQREAINIQDATDRVMSRALAVAAASGGGASDPTVVNNIAKIASEGAYRQAVALYEGEDAARSMENQAEGSEYQGKVANAKERMTGFGQLMPAATSLLKGEARGSLYQKYGGGGPRLNQDKTEY